MKNLSKIKGFSLIEVMVSLVILALGMLGIAKLQANLIQVSSDANQRTVAVSLAQQKLDDLKSFAKLTVGTSTDSVPDNWAAVSGTIADTNLAFDHIADNQGGAMCSSGLDTAEALVVATHCPNAANLTSIGNYNYELNWDVTNYVYVAGVATATAATTDIDFKRVVVNVAWTDESGNNQNITLDTVIDSYAPALSALANNSSTGGSPPKAFYTPEAAPDVLNDNVGQNDLGDGLKRQTSKPLPDAVKTGADSNTLVTFEVVTFHENPADSNEFFADRQEEFLTVDCKCTLSAANGTAYPPGHVVWDESEDDRYDYVGTPVSKPTSTQTNNANAVDDICAVCCRDHHDVTSTALDPKVRFDGQAVAAGDHNHYKADGTVAVAGEEYIEACRFKRIDGVMRVFQDWNLQDLVVMNRDDLDEGDPLQVQYASYVNQLLLDHAESTALATKPALRTPLTIPMPDPVQLESRGVYLDKVYNLATGALSSEYASYIADSNNLDRLEKIPFAQVNLSLLSQWLSEDDTKVTVTSEDVATISDPANSYYGTYSRGEITPLVAVASPGVDITSTMDPTNDGITQIAVNPSPASPKSDTMAVTVAGVSSNITVSGSVDGSTLPGGTKFTMTGCNLAANGNFSCTYPSGSDVNISVEAYKKNTACDPAGGGSFSQSNVTSDLTGISITLTCP